MESFQCGRGHSPRPMTQKSIGRFRPEARGEAPEVERQELRMLYGDEMSRRGAELTLGKRRPVQGDL